MTQPHGRAVSSADHSESERDRLHPTAVVHHAVGKWGRSVLSVTFPYSKGDFVIAAHKKALLAGRRDGSTELAEVRSAGSTELSTRPSSSKSEARSDRSDAAAGHPPALVVLIRCLEAEAAVLGRHSICGS